MVLSKKQKKKQARLQIKRNQQERKAEEQLLLAQSDSLSMEPSYQEHGEEHLQPTFLTLAQKLVDISFSCAASPQEVSRETLSQWADQLARVAVTLQEASYLWSEKLQTPNEKELRKRLQARGEEIKRIQDELRVLQRDREKHYTNASFFSNLLYQVATSWFTNQKKMPNTTINAIPGCLPPQEQKVWGEFLSFYDRAQSIIVQSPHSARNEPESETIHNEQHTEQNSTETYDKESSSDQDHT